MPDMNDLQNWAANRAGDGAIPQTPVEGDTDEQHQEQHDQTEMEPGEAMEFVAKECNDAIEALKKVRDKLEDPEAADELIESLQGCADKATAAAEELAEEKPEDEDEEPETPEPQPEE